MDELVLLGIEAPAHIRSTPPALGFVGKAKFVRVEDVVVAA